MLKIVVAFCDYVSVQIYAIKKVILFVFYFICAFCWCVQDAIFIPCTFDCS